MARIPLLNWPWKKGPRILAPRSFATTELKMEYLGLLPLGAAVIGVGLRSYFSMMTADTEQAGEPRQRNSAKAKRTMEKAIVRRLLRYHRGLVHA